MNDESDPDSGKSKSSKRKFVVRGISLGSFVLDVVYDIPILMDPEKTTSTTTTTTQPAPLESLDANIIDIFWKG
tara:strand:+ start:124 stop:345 length:222 start_codon:yes stop_codon:yes gene_type:complete